MRQAIEDANRHGLTVEDLARLRLFCAELPAEPRLAMDFEAATEYVFRKNAELYRRLA